MSGRQENHRDLVWHPVGGVYSQAQRNAGNNQNRL
jgi:hypothetical protein